MRDEDSDARDALVSGRADGARRRGRGPVAAAPPSTTSGSHLADNPRLPAARLFATKTGTQLRAYHVQQAWQTARKKDGYPEARIHDLRHASLTLNAQLGATTAELMRRAGHASARAAQHYQHAAKSRDQHLAALLSKLDRAQGHI